MAQLPTFKPSWASTTASQVVSVQPLSAPSTTLQYMDTQSKGRSKRGRPSAMRRFKIKYTNTKGIIKTRNIKATSEERAMSEISDMQQHHYTIVESLDEPEPEREHKNPCTEIQLPSGFAVELPTVEKIKQEVRELEEKRKLMEKWAPIIENALGDSISELKKEMLAKYAQQHQEVTMYDSNTFLPIAKKVAAQTMSLDLSDMKPEKDGGYDTELTQEDWDAANDSYDGFNSMQPANNDSWNG
jgi:hypothetical protein